MENSSKTLPIFEKHWFWKELLNRNIPDFKNFPPNINCKD